MPDNTYQTYFISQISPAPALPGNDSPNEKNLLDLLDAGDRFSVLFHLGNIALRKLSFDEAITNYLDALKEQAENAAVRMNLSVAYYCDSKFDEAGFQARRSLLLNNTLSLAQLVVAASAVELAQFEPAQLALEKARQLNPLNPVPVSMAAEIAVLQQDIEQALQLYLKVLQLDPKDATAEAFVSSHEFELGTSQLKAGDLELAFQTWGNAYFRAPRMFIADQRIATEFEKLIADYRDERYAADYSKYIENFKTNPDDKSGAFDLVARFLFSIGLFPEAYESRSGLMSSRLRWEESLLKQGDHPYPHFRFALIFLYQGNWEAALQELTYCQDKLPPKKQSALKLGAIFRFAQNLRDLEAHKDEFRNSNLSADEWERAGFSNQFQIQVWKESGLPPAEAFRWMQAGFGPKQASVWRANEVEPEVAKNWEQAGFKDAREVRMWIRSDFSAEEAKHWTAECPMPQDYIVQSKKAGLTDPALAYRWSGLLTVPWEAGRWHELGFSPEEAREWMDHGFRESYTAAMWKNQGHSPATALKAFAGQGS